MLWAFRDRILDLKKDTRFRYVLIFKNHGEPGPGATLEHSHSQLIALPIVPIRVREEVDGSKGVLLARQGALHLACDIIRQEIQSEVRVIFRCRRFSHRRPLRPALSLRDLDFAEAA